MNMKANKVTGKTVVSVLAVSVVMCMGAVSPVQARDGWDGRDRRGHDSDRYDHGRDYRSHGDDRHDRHEGSSLARSFLKILVGGLEYYCCEGQYYRPATAGYVVVPAPIGAVVTTIPAGCQTMIVGGVPYYTACGNTYRRTRDGYLVVQPPRVVVVQAPVVRVSRW